MSKVPKTLMPQGEDFQARHALSLTLHAPTPVAHRNYVAMVPFVMMHVAAACAPLFGVDWGLILLAVGMYYLRMFGITAGYHRYFAHRAFKTGRTFQFVLALLATMSAQKGVLWWAAHHRHHHKHSDQPDDIHSPIQQGFVWSHVGWILDTRHDATRWDKIPDFARYPELRWLNQHHLVPPTALAVVLFLWGGMPALMWGFFVSTVALFHGTFTINSLSHVFGSRRFHTTDTSKNNFLLALLTMGEGWHNNHHHYQSSANQGFYWWEVDVTFYVLWVLERLHVVRELRRPPSRVLDAGRRGVPALPAPQAAAVVSPVTQTAG